MAAAAADAALAEELLTAALAPGEERGAHAAARLAEACARSDAAAAAVASRGGAGALAAAAAAAAVRGDDALADALSAAVGAVARPADAALSAPPFREFSLPAPELGRDVLLRVAERRVDNASATTGTAVWAASLMLAARLCEDYAGDVLECGSLLELGCGCGCPALAAAALGARAVAASDYRQELLATVEESRSMLEADARARLTTLVLDWERESAAWSAGERAAAADSTFGMVVGAEIIYEAEHPQLVARTVARRLARGGAAEPGDAFEPLALLSLGVRSERRLQQLRDELAAAGLRVRRERELVVDDDVWALGGGEGAYIGADIGVGKCRVGAAGGGFVLLEVTHAD